MPKTAFSEKAIPSFPDSPAVVLVTDGESRLIRRRETVEELLRYET